MSKPRSRRIPPRPSRRTSPRLRRSQRSLGFEPLEPRELLATIVVNTTGDGNDPTAATISLREAIEISNGTLAVSALSGAAQGLVFGTVTAGVPNTIGFALPTGSIQTISPTSALPAITQPVTISGYSQSGSAPDTSGKIQVDVNNAMVQIDGSLIPSGSPVDGLDIKSANCVVDGLIITGFSGAGISISGAGSQGNWLWGNFLGALPDTSTGRLFDQPSLGNLVAGVEISASNNLVGGNTDGLFNVMANSGIGVLLTGAGGTGNLIEGNAIVYNAAQGVLVDSSNNTIGEALSGGGNVISGNGAQGIEITGGVNVQGNQVLGNFIGTDLGSPDGAIVKGESALPNAEQGILIEGSPKNTIGGSTGAALNVIGSNLLDGIEIDGAAATGNRVLGNNIGFNVVNSLIAFLPNQNGISITSAGNFIGDSSSSTSGNTISDNRLNGILLTGAGATGNVIAGNIIGLNPGGGSIFRNSFDGIHIDNAPGNTIGGTTADARNTITGNNNGVYITGAGATGNVVEGNFIGTGSDGLTSLGNAVDGVVVDNAPGNTIGGTASGAGNVISGNNRGIVITGSGSTADLVQGNCIGTDLTGTANIHNQVDGVLITATASGNTIGGMASGAGNTIEHNVGDGVDVDSGTTNSIFSNTIYTNTGVGIFLNQANSANNNQVPPVLSVVTPNTTVDLHSGDVHRPCQPGRAPYTIQFFAKPPPSPRPVSSKARRCFTRRPWFPAAAARRRSRRVFPWSFPRVSGSRRRPLTITASPRPWAIPRPSRAPWRPFRSPCSSSRRRPR